MNPLGDLITSKAEFGRLSLVHSYHSKIQYPMNYFLTDIFEIMTTLRKITTAIWGMGERFLVIFRTKYEPIYLYLNYSTTILVFWGELERFLFNPTSKATIDKKSISLSTHTQLTLQTVLA